MIRNKLFDYFVMNFNSLNPLNRPSIKLLEYTKEDFTLEELEIIDQYCKSLLYYISNQDKHLLFKNKIPKPINFTIEGSFENGFRSLKEKGLVIDDGLCFKTFLYYEHYISKDLKYTNYLCKLIITISKNENDILSSFSPPFLSGIRDFFHLSEIETVFLTYILNDLGLIHIEFGFSDSNRKDYRHYKNLRVYDITDDGRDFNRDICPIQNFKEFAGYIKKLKDEYLFEDYSNIQIRIVALKHDSFWEILYFRLDFTMESMKSLNPRYSYPDKKLILFEEIIKFTDLTKNIKIVSSVLIYFSKEFEFEFIHFVKFPFNYHIFKEGIKPIYNRAKVICEDQLNFIYFELLDQQVYNFNYDEILKIEFKEDKSNKIRNSTEVINEFIGYNINSLSEPFVIIIYPIKSFKVIETHSKIDIGKRIKISWNANPKYENFFRCKTVLKGNSYNIPREGLDIPINDITPNQISCIVQWNGKSNLANPNDVLSEIIFKNPYKVRFGKKAEKKISIELKNCNRILFDNFLKDFLSIIDLIEGDTTMKSLIRQKNYREENFRDFFKTHFESKNDWFYKNEFKGKVDRKNDLKIISKKDKLFRISIEFKIWKRNFHKNEPVQELLDNMGNYDKKGVILMINPNKNQINKKLKLELIEMHPKYISNSYEDIKIEDRLFTIYKALYKYNKVSIEVYHIILDLFTYFRTIN